LRVRPAVLVDMAIALLGSSSSRAATFTFSELRSDTTPAEWLAARLDYAMVDATTLEIRVRNETAAPAFFDITLVFFNTASQVDYLSLVSAKSSLDGENARTRGTWATTATTAPR
jgi:hypothetical protein